MNGVCMKFWKGEWAKHEKHNGMTNIEYFKTILKLRSSLLRRDNKLGLTVGQIVGAKDATRRVRAASGVYSKIHSNQFTHEVSQIFEARF